MSKQGCDGQAADAVSAYTQVKMEDAHKLLVEKRFLIGNAYSYTVKKGLFLSVYVDDIKIG